MEAFGLNSDRGVGCNQIVMVGIIPIDLLFHIFATHFVKR